VNFYATSSDWTKESEPTPITTVNFGDRLSAPEHLYLGKHGTNRDGFVAAQFANGEMLSSAWHIAAWTRMACNVIQESGYLPVVRSGGLESFNAERRLWDHFRSDYKRFITQQGVGNIPDVEKRICPP
jgi:hypothetical protein